MKHKFFRWVVILTLILSMTLAPCTAFAKAKTMKMVKTTVSGARLREGPGNYDVITTLKKGEVVFFSGKTVNAFCQVCTSGGTVGYVYKGYLKPYGTVRMDQIYYNSGKTKLYKKASTSARAVASLNSKQFVLVFKKAGSWAFVKTMNGKSGYVPLKKLQAMA